MATLFTHVFAAYGINKLAPQFNGRRHCMMYSIILSVLPDTDVLGFAFGIAYSDFLGHRGFSHSLFFAFLLSIVIVLLLFRSNLYTKQNKLIIFLLLFISAASHGILDALTNGGLGVAFFSPFDTTRYFFTQQPLEVSPIGIQAFFSNRGIKIILNEMLYIWLPFMLLIIFGACFKYSSNKR